MSHGALSGNHSPYGFVLLDGRFVRSGRISPLDLPGLLDGDGLFETVRIEDGRVFRFSRHLDRLRRSSERVGLPLRHDDATLARWARRCWRRCAPTPTVLRLALIRSLGGGSVLITARPAPEEGGVVSCRLAGEHPGGAGLKSISYQPFRLALAAAAAAGADEAVLTRGGRAVEGSRSSLFLVRGGRIATPDVGSGCLPGIARAALLESLREAGIPGEERPIRVEELSHAEEIWFTNAVRGLQPAASVDGRPLPGAEGRLFLRIRPFYWSLVARERLPL